MREVEDKLLFSRTVLVQNEKLKEKEGIIKHLAGYIDLLKNEIEKLKKELETNK